MAINVALAGGKMPTSLLSLEVILGAQAIRSSCPGVLLSAFILLALPSCLNSIPERGIVMCTEDSSRTQDG